MIDGFIQILVLGGNPPYQYSWLTHPSFTGNQVYGLKADNYLVEVRDSDDCMAIGGPINIIEP